MISRLFKQCCSEARRPSCFPSYWQTNVPVTTIFASPSLSPFIRPHFSFTIPLLLFLPSFSHHFSVSWSCSPFFFKLSFYSGFYFLFSSLLLTSLTSHVSHLSDLSSLTFMSFTLCLPPTSPSPYTYPFLPLPIRTMIRPKKRFWNTKLALAS